MTLKCAHCGNEFEAKRGDAKYCSPACRKAASRLANLTWDGVEIRGQHETDIPPTGLGIETANCQHCSRPFSRWIEAKLARLVRNEIEGSIHWENRDFDHHKFDLLMDYRMQERKFCSNECQTAWAADQYLNQHSDNAVLHTTEGDEMKIDGGILRVRRRYKSEKAELIATAAPNGTATFAKRRGQ